MTYANFDIKTDLKVELYLPSDNGVFILGLSKLGGSDVLGDTAGAGFTWQEVSGTVSDVQITRGGDVNSGAIFQLEPGSARITIQSDALDPMANRAVRLGTRIRVRTLNSLNNFVEIFNGYVDEADVSYAINGVNTIRFTAFDVYKRAIQYRHSVFNVATGGYAYDIITQAVAPLGIATRTGLSSSTGTFRQGAYVETEATGGDIINKAMEAELGFLYFDPFNNELVFLDNATVDGLDLDAGYTYELSNTHSSDPSHLCFTNIAVQAGDSSLANSIYATLDGTSTTVTRTDLDSVELYGYVSLDVDLKLYDVATLTAWANAISKRKPTKRVTSITTSAINQTGGLTPAAVAIDLGGIINVNYTRNGYTINQASLVANLTHNITADYWLTTFGLWRPKN